MSAPVGATEYVSTSDVNVRLADLLPPPVIERLRARLDALGRAALDVLAGRGALASADHMLAALLLLVVRADAGAVAGRDAACHWLLARLGDPPVRGAERRAAVAHQWSRLSRHERRRALLLAWSGVGLLSPAEILADPAARVLELRRALDRELPRYLAGPGWRSAPPPAADPATALDPLEVLAATDAARAELARVLEAATSGQARVIHALLRRLSEGADHAEARKAAAADLGVTTGAIETTLTRLRRRLA